MKEHLLTALRLTLICVLFFSGIYTLFIWGIAQAAPNHGEGQTVVAGGKIVGYALEGQAFTHDDYFWSRPSAAAYKADASAGSNKGPTNPDYLKDVQAHVDTFLAHNPGVTKEAIPAELVTYSGSGLDPDISPAGAKIQMRRVAAARRLPEAKLNDLIDRYTQGPLLGIFGPSIVNVLRLNVALDEMTRNGR